TCGSRRVISVEEDVVLTVREMRHRFQGVPHERCLECGERIFGIEASQRFDEAMRHSRIRGKRVSRSPRSVTNPAPRRAVPR
ncbi:MAG: YgiT-type zinc finger protein, partial [Alphaproteobacteria bacterium]